MKHTPGPWKFKSDGLYSKDFPILWCTQGRGGALYLGANEDDTHIIVHSPEMFEALLPFARRATRITREGETPSRVVIPFDWLLAAKDVLESIIAGPFGDTYTTKGE